MRGGQFPLAFPRWMCDAPGMSIRKRMDSCPVYREPPEGYALSEVEVRVATPQERPLWDALMDAHHYLGFRRLAGRGLRYVATFGRRWLGLAAWQNGAFKCAPRDRWTGWKPQQQFRRLEMVANNTRFLILSEPGVFPNLASRFLAGMTRRLSEDWLEAHGHRVLLAETFCDPEVFAGTMYRAAGWEGLGETKGFARANGRYTDPHDKPKAIFVKALRPDARALLSSPQPLPGDVAPPAGPALAPRDPGAMRSLHAELAAVPDFRRAQGKKHTVACVLTVHLLAELANMKGCLGAAQFARSLSQEELEAVGAWLNPKTGLREPVSKSTLHRVVQSVDPEALEDVVGRWSRPRLPLARALAADGKRIRGANRNGDGHHETVALVDHDSGAPFALLNFDDDGGEQAATHDLLERSDISGKVLTLDALHTTRKTAKLITERAHYVFVVKGNASQTFDLLDTIDWDSDAAGRFAQDLDKVHGRLEQRSISVLTPPHGLVNYPGVRQIARVTRYREPLNKSPDDTGKGENDYTETVYLITSLDAGAASAQELLRLNRGHWAVENLNHRQRDCVYGEDACLTRTGHGPANRASLNNIALAVIFANRREAESLAETRRRLQLDRSAAIAALTRP